MDLIKDVIPKTLADYHLLGTYRLHHLLGRWSDIAGPRISTHTYVDTFKDGYVYIIANHPVFLQEVRMHSSLLVKKINEMYGAPVIKGIKVRLGPKQQLMEKTLQDLGIETSGLFEEGFVPGECIHLAPSLGAYIEDTLSHLPDGPLKSAIRRAAYAMEKKKFYLKQQGFDICPTCGRYLYKGEKSCLICEYKEKERRISLLMNYLYDYPYFLYDDLANYVPQTTLEEVSEARRLCIQHYIDRLKQGSTSLYDRYMVVMLIKKKKASDLTQSYVLQYTERFLKKDLTKRK